MKKKRILGVIPAKGGSTRLPRKNILPLGGKPMLQWAVESARQSGLIDRLIVSTEDAEVADVAKKLGVDVPFIRPQKLAKDPAGVVQVTLHAIEMLREQGDEYDEVIILLPTSPFRSAQDITDAYRLFQEKHAEFLMSVSEFSHTPYAAMTLENDILAPVFPELIGRKSQEMPPAYRPNGALHILNIKAFEREKSYFAQPLVGYVMPLERSVDIDTKLDLIMAEAMLALANAEAAHEE
ncbi:MAG TPA: acylneuraminate cytidylyltransferase family protein [Pseudomonadales bacterium]|nr:acylneuraminate cytidylyltransferase family protein [Pseudomonadales bacterium]